MCLVPSFHPYKVRPHDVRKRFLLIRVLYLADDYCDEIVILDFRYGSMVQDLNHVYGSGVHVVQSNDSPKEHVSKRQNIRHLPSSERSVCANRCTH